MGRHWGLVPAHYRRGPVDLAGHAETEGVLHRDLSVDPREQANVIDQYPEVVDELTAILRRYVEKGRSIPDAPQKNSDGSTWWRGTHGDDGPREHEGSMWWEGLPWDPE
jgi:hypothetical protein